MLRCNAQFQPRTSLFRSYEHVKQLILRKIYTVEQLDVDKYVKDRENIQTNLQPGSIAYKKDQLRKYLHGKDSIQKGSLLTQFLYIIENRDDDFELLEKALNKFKTTQLDNMRRSNFGTILMKMLYHFRRDDWALKFYSDPILRNKLLNGKQCNLAFFDLLYKQKEFSKLLQHFDNLKDRLEAKQQPLTRSIYVLVFATCYSQNTKKSFEYAMELHNKYKNAHITQDHLIFLAALALNQNEPHVADQLFSTLWPTAHESIASLRVLALVRMRKFVEVLKICRSIIVTYDENSAAKKQVISNEVMEEANRAFEQYCESEDLQNDFQKIRSNLKTHGYLVNKGIQTLIFEPFKSTNMTKLQKKRMFLQAEFNQTLNT